MGPAPGSYTTGGQAPLRPPSPPPLVLSLLAPSGMTSPTRIFCIMVWLCNTHRASSPGVIHRRRVGSAAPASFGGSVPWWTGSAHLVSTPGRAHSSSLAEPTHLCLPPSFSCHGCLSWWEQKDRDKRVRACSTHTRGSTQEAGGGLFLVIFSHLLFDH